MLLTVFEHRVLRVTRVGGTETAWQGTTRFGPNEKMIDDDELEQVVDVNAVPGRDAIKL